MGLSWKAQFEILFKELESPVPRQLYFETFIKALTSVGSQISGEYDFLLFFYSTRLWCDIFMIWKKKKNNIFLWNDDNSWPRYFVRTHHPCTIHLHLFNVVCTLMWLAGDMTSSSSSSSTLAIGKWEGSGVVDVALLPMEATFTPGFVLLLAGVGFFSLLLLLLLMLLCRRALARKRTFSHRYQLPLLQVFT